MRLISRNLRVVIFLSLCALALAQVGCSGTVKNARGKTVVIKSPPRRIVSLTPNNTEILFALGLGPRVVGVTAYCDYPPAAKKKPKVGDRTISVEKVVALKPDLILAHAVLNDDYVRRFEALGMTVIAIDSETYDGVASDIAMIGRATGTTKQATKIVRQMKAAAFRVKSRKPPKKRLNVLVVVQPSPLWAAGPKTLIDEMLRYCGASNVASNAKPGFNQFPVESAIARKPDVIIAGKGESKFFLNSPLWRGTAAVRNKRVYEVDFDLLVRPGPRLAVGLLKLSELLR